MDIDLMDLETALAVMNDEDGNVAIAVRKAIPAIAEAVMLLESALREGGRVFYVGAGTSGRLGLLDAAECPPTFGTAPEQIQAVMAGGGEAAGRAKEGAEDDLEAGRRDLLERALSSGDVVVGLAASGRTPYVIGAMRVAREVGAKTVAVVCNASGPLLELADVGIPVVVGPEVVMGSTRLKAGTAQKLVLNMLSTLTMVRLGKVFTNLMVDMQATNEKLRSRAIRMLSLATGLGLNESGAALADAGGSLKTALVAQLAGVDAAEAANRLDKARGSVRNALKPSIALDSREPAGVIRDDARAASQLSPEGPAYYLGVDGGQSGTRCLLVREDGVVCGEGKAGTIPHLLAPGGREGLKAVLKEAVAGAVGGRDVRIQAAFLGLTGVVAGRLADAAREVGREVIPAGQIFVDHDGMIAWAGALGSRPGLIAIAGTGSLVLGVDAAGQAERAGGWGYLFGDEPGAFGIALAAIKSATRDADSGRKSALLAEVLAYFGVLDMGEVTKAYYAGEIERANIARLTPRLAVLAETCPEAADLFAGAARVLAEQMLCVAQRLHWESETVEWAPIGGVFNSGAVFLGPLERQLGAGSSLVFRRREPELPPVAGAVLLAARHSGMPGWSDFATALRKELA